ncbi:MAG: tetratricopeptide repeat protein [Acidobacteria bacterium]|nr:tetratricopeptide repeat protein [Acidobacteriota bacterium]
MSKNILLCSLGIILGFVIGFFIANAVTRPGTPVARARSASNDSAGPLDPEQSAGALPPGHPDINGAGGADDEGGSAAASSAEAQAAMDKADRSPQDFDAQIAAGDEFYSSRDYGKSALYFDRALALKPKDFAALVGMANTKYDANDFVGAASYYERALAIKPDDPDVRTDYGNTFFNRVPPDYDRAIAEYRKSVAIDPNHAKTWKNIAAAALLKRDKTTASDALKHLEDIAPQSPELPELRQSVEKLP